MTEFNRYTRNNKANVVQKKLNEMSKNIEIPIGVKTRQNS